MLSAELLGTLEKVVTGAVRVTGTYKKRSDGSHRAFAGVNVVMCADFWQLHPVGGTFLAANPLGVPAGCAQRALEFFLARQCRLHSIVLELDAANAVRRQRVQ